MSVLGITPKKPTPAKFFKKVYKIRAIIVFSVLAILVLQYFFFNLIQGQFLSKKYQFNRNIPYVKDISLLIFLLSKLKSIFSIVVTFSRVQQSFKNKEVLKIPENCVISVTNPLVYYLIVKIGYAKLLLITKLIVRDIKLEFNKKKLCL